MRAAVTLVAAMATLTACAPPAEEQPDAPRLNHTATEAQTKARSDAFGIENIMRTRPGGTIWTSHWSGVRRFDGVDPEDRWFDGDHGSATYKVRHGKLLVTGNIPRMYVYDPARTRQWGDVEVTVYFKRVRDTGIPYAGMTIVARSNHLDTESGRFECDTRGYGARLRYDGHTDFEKETAYPINEATANKELWPHGLPRNRWIGMKFIVFDETDGVHLETWLDLADGRDGGHWHRINAVVDDGNLFGYEPCRTGVDPRMPLTNDPRRKGSETGKPNLTVYFRSDGVGQDGLVYNWASIREIEPERLP